MKKYLLFLCALFCLSPLVVAQTPLGDTVVTQALRDSLSIDGEWESVPITDPFDLGDTIFIDSGKVGIGTSTPAQTLTVAGGLLSAATAPGLWFTDTDGDADEKNWIWAGRAGGTLRLQALTDAGAGGGSVVDFQRIAHNVTAMSVGTVAAPTLFVDITNAKVGMGTLDPTSSLSIWPDNSGAKITLRDGTAGNHNGFGTDSLQMNYHVVGTSSTNLHAFFGGGTNGDGVELMRIRGDGRVGIGTTDPTHSLDVANATDTNLLRLVDTGAVSYAVTSGATPARIMLDANSTNVLSIQSTGGLVGIGLIAPDEELHVEGTGNVGVKIDGSSGGCLMIRDTDDAGWTECFTLNGVLSCTIDADGLCDGS